MSAAASIAVLMKQGKEGSELKENVERLHRLIEAQAAREEDAAELTRNTFAAAAHLIARVERGEAPDSQLDAFAKTEAAGIVAPTGRCADATRGRGWSPRIRSGSNDSWEKH
jgi:hypothetical protein